MRRSARAALLAAGRAYLLRDFRQAASRVAGTLNGTPAEPGPGMRTAADTEGRLSVAAGKLACAGGKAVPAWGDPGVWYPAQARAAGRVLLMAVTPAQANQYHELGWCRAQSGQAADGAVQLNNAAGIRCDDNNAALAVYAGSYTAGVTYQVAVVLRAAGAFWFVKGGTYADWTLLYASTAGAVATLYPGITNHGAAFGVEDVRVPADAWLPAPALHAAFDVDANPLALSDAAGPDGQHAPVSAWPGGAGWQALGGVARSAPAQGAEVVVNGGFDSDTAWAKGAAWSIGGGRANKANGSGTELQQSVLTAGGWYRATWTVVSVSGSSLFAMFGSSASGYGPGRSAPGAYVETGRAVGTVAGITANSATVGSVDDVSYRPLALSSLLNVPDLGTADVLVEADLTGLPAGVQCGFGLRWDSQAAPASGILVFADGSGNVRVDKTVAGTPTFNLVAGAVTGAGRLVVQLIGGTLRVFYKDALVGSTTNIADVPRGTRHGPFVTDAAADKLTRVTVWPAGTEGQHAALSTL